MDSLKISTGVISLRILDDEGNERGIFRFNPNDVKVAQKFLEMQQSVDAREKEFASKSENCKTADEQIALLSEYCDYFKGLIDECFGGGTSQLLFGDANSLEMFADFFAGITPYYQKASNDRIAKYKAKNTRKRSK